MLNSYFRVYKILAIASCFAYCYHLKSISGFIFFISLSIIFALTRFFESEPLSKLVQNIILSNYLVSLPFGCIFLYQAIKTTPPEKTTSTYFLILFISFSFLVWIVVNLINYYNNGRNAFIESNNSTFKSEELTKKEEESKNLNSFVDKYRK